AGSQMAQNLVSEGPSSGAYFKNRDRPAGPLAQRKYNRFCQMGRTGSNCPRGAEVTAELGIEETVILKDHILSTSMTGEAGREGIGFFRQYKTLSKFFTCHTLFRFLDEVLDCFQINLLLFAEAVRVDRLDERSGRIQLVFDLLDEIVSVAVADAWRQL